MPWVGLIMLLAGGAVLAWGLVVVQTALGLVWPPRRGYAFAVSRGLPSNPGEVGPDGGGPFEYREWSVPVSGASGRIEVWEALGREPGGPVVVWSHGWGESRVHGLQRLGGLAKGASRVVLYDLRGHGESGGWCALGTREVEDLMAVVGAARGEKEGRVVVGGFSLGAGVSVAAAAKEGGRTVIAGVIAEAPYRMPGTPAAAVLEGLGMSSRWTLGPALALAGWVQGQGLWWAKGGARLGVNGFDRAALAGKLRVPLLVLHGTRDGVCPLEDGAAMVRAAREGGCASRMVEVEGAGHADLWTLPAARETCGREVEAFVRSLGAAPEGAGSGGACGA